ncbi:plasma kallikrein-like isoform 3 precursor [Dinothrombium tinctorium]|uniref:Plasma kallikrein-like isoform 3 n=1 Tax=Dinothrombium tinctorium TaxID=1965070 RepID=A0A3S3S203_9ACAR|nr:plasma kallikrein-like isoform 3 precursor [Dinothrombium tinctorium]
MDQPVSFASNHSFLRPACLDLNGELETEVTNKTLCIGTGFGLSKAPPNHNRSLVPSEIAYLYPLMFRNVLRELRLKLDNHQNCRNLFKILKVTEKQFCMASKNEHNYAYNGDSGGPLQCHISGKWIQVGVMWGGSPRISIFQKIYKYADFIERISGYKLIQDCASLNSVFK